MDQNPSIGNQPTPPQPPQPEGVSQFGVGESTSSRKIPFKVLGVVLILVLLIGGGVVGMMRLLGGRQQNELITLTWWGLWEDGGIVQPLIEEYENSHQNVKITYVRQSPQDYRERLTSSLAKSAGPDIFRFHNTWVSMFANDLTTLLPEVLSTSEFQSRFYPIAASDLTHNGRIVGIPLEIDGLGLYINTALFQSANLQPPTTWDELRRAALTLTTRDAAGGITQAGVALGTVNNVDHWQDILSLMMLQNGANPARPTDKRAEDALAFYTIFATADKVWDETLPPSTLSFASGKVAMYFAPSWEVFEIKAKNSSLSFRIVPVPQLPKSTPEEKDITWASYWAEGVWARSKHPKEAFEFLKFMSEKESLEKLYRNGSQTRLFGEPYPRPDMAELLLNDPLTGAYVRQAPTTHSWYLAGRTFDGPTGINSRISKYFEDAVNKVLKGGTPTEALKTVEQGVSQVLSSYGAR
ncbi:sugar ABC transporter substrate-binding protein [Candidatus Microgenomates bacterium]|nr:sugar ABC transporter substrate-binding protein [Candidatus Microgenomates bacterium]